MNSPRFSMLNHRVAGSRSPNWLYKVRVATTVDDPMDRIPRRIEFGIFEGSKDE